MLNSKFFKPMKSIYNYHSVCNNSSMVGFIGLGNMGREMASHLINKGNKLVVYDLNPDAVKEMEKKGAKAASSYGQVANECNHIFTMLPTGKHVLDVYTSENGLIANAKSGSILADSSTVGPDTSQEVAMYATKRGVNFLDTPVSGAVPAAKEASLTFMVGGPKDKIEEITPYLMCMGKNVVHCGDIGMGVAAKICNNMMLAISMVGTSETLNLGKNMGLDPKLMTQILNISSGRTWSSEIYNPVPGVMENVPASNNYEDGFQVPLITKDLGLASVCANQSQSPIPLGALCYQIYRLILQNGYDKKDFSSIYKYFEIKN